MLLIHFIKEKVGPDIETNYHNAELDGKYFMHGKFGFLTEFGEQDRSM